jgi:hypothetical protein
MRLVLGILERVERTETDGLRNVEPAIHSADFIRANDPDRFAVSDNPIALWRFFVFFDSEVDTGFRWFTSRLTLDLALGKFSGGTGVGVVGELESYG